MAFGPVHGKLDRYVSHGQKSETGRASTICVYLLSPADTDLSVSRETSDFYKA
jgi:hypothetical protein